MTGHTVSAAHTAMSALSIAAGKPGWDAFILDIGLPDLTGYELAGRLRALPSAKDAMFVAVTGYGQAQDRLTSKTSGFDHHLAKPADIPRLLELLAGKDAA